MNIWTPSRYWEVRFLLLAPKEQIMNKIIEGTEICKDNITLMEMGKFCSIMESNEEVKGVVDYFVEWDYNFLLTNYIKEVLKRYETQ